MWFSSLSHIRLPRGCPSPKRSPEAECLHTAKSLTFPCLSRRHLLGYIGSHSYACSPLTGQPSSVQAGGAKAQITTTEAEQSAPVVNQPWNAGMRESSSTEILFNLLRAFCSNTATTLYNSCCKQKAGTPSKQNNFLPEDKSTRTFAQLAIHIHSISWMGIPTQSATQEEQDTGFTLLIQLARSRYTS